MDSKALAKSIGRELEENLLPFWRERVLAPSGGFIAEMASDGTVNRHAPKGLVLTARLLGTFSALYRDRGHARDRLLAKRAYDDLSTYFFDRDCGGYLWRLTPVGRPLDCSKKVCGQAFCIQALSAYHRASGNAAALDAATVLFHLIERHAHDPAHQGYVEALGREWGGGADLRLGDKDMDAAKSMNNHLHLLEAYAELYRSWPDALVADRLRELIDVFELRMLADTGHFNLFFDEDWTVRSDSYAYGRDIEAAWLLYDAAEALGDGGLKARMSDWAVGVAHAVAEEALHPNGGLLYEGRNGKVIDAGREWWPQAEAVLGFHLAWRLTGDRRFAEIVEDVWDFILRRLADRENGEWFWRIHPDGAPDLGAPKVSEWKGPYHGVRMCLRMLDQLRREASQGTMDG